MTAGETKRTATRRTGHKHVPRKGIPDREIFKRWSDDIAEASTWSAPTLERAHTSQQALTAYLEELLRFDSPVQAAFRRAKLDFELHGQTIRRGDHVLLLLGAANRDPDQFPDPDTLDLGRQPNRHLAFSMGAHYCLGAHLARLEGRIAIQSLFSRFPSMQFAPVPLVWRPNVLFRGLERLPVVVA